MELFKSIVAVVGIIATIYFLIKKAETLLAQGGFYANLYNSQFAV